MSNSRWSSLRILLAVWGVTRVLLVVFTSVRALPHSVWFASAADVYAYQDWAHSIVASGAFPLDDDRWQYPPGVGPLILLPNLPGFGYWWWFFAMIVAADAAALWLLIRAGKGTAVPLAGAWVWTIGVALVGRVCYGRFDLIVSAVAVAALLYAVRRPALAGAAIAVGALLKVWPLALLIGLRRWRPLLTTAGSTVAVLGVGTAVIAGIWPGALSFLRFQSERGLQIESVAATPLLIARLFSSRWTIPHRYGAEEIVGPWVSAVAGACVIAMAIAFIMLLIWWVRRSWTAATVADGAMFAVLLALVTSRVLSPQYLVWVVGIGAVCVLTRATSQRPVVTLVLIAALVTQVEYPFMYDRVATGSWPGVLVLTVRNGLLLWATVRSGLQLWRAELQPSESAATVHTEMDNSGV